jgi:hypothetical protein
MKACRPQSLEIFRLWHIVVVAWEVEFIGFPHSSKVSSSRYPQMRELRTQSAGRPLRTLYAFNPLRSAILSRTGFLNDTCLSSRRKEDNAHSQFS